MTWFIRQTPLCASTSVRTVTSAEEKSISLIMSVTTMNFTENQQGSVILEKLHSQRKEGRFCDVRFHVNSSEILAHRNVLAASSPYFDTLLKMNSSNRMEHITIECKDQNVFELLLNYIYTGNIVVESTIVEELVRLSNRFILPKLKGYCCEYLERNMNITNCFMTKDIAQKTGLSSLAKTVESFIMANIMDVIHQDELLEFTDKKILDFVSNKTLPIREELKIHVLNRWIRHSTEERQYRFYSMLNSLVWSKVNVPVVYQLLQEDSLYKDSPWCLYVMLKTLNEKGFLPDAYRQMLVDLQAKYAQDDVTEMFNLPVDSTNKSVYVEEQIQQDGGDNKSIIGVKHEHSSKDGENAQQCGNSKESEEPPFDKDGTPCLQTEDELYESLGASDPNISAIIDDDYSETSDVLNISKELNDLESPSNGEHIDSKRPGRHKRKGIPIKIDSSPIRVRISKVKLKMESSRVPRKRGRPPKMLYKKETTKCDIQLTQTKASESGNLAQDSEEGNEENDQNFNPNTEDEDDLKLPTSESKKGQRIKRRRGRKPKNHSKLSCGDCQFVTTSSEKLQRHREKAHKNLTVYTCSLCKYQTAWNREYYNHMKTHFPGPPFTCDFACGYSADRIQNLLYHRMSHTDERPFECTECNMSFRSKNNLAMHARCHTGLKPFKCDVCGRSFATKGTLDQHSVTHSDLRPYLCDLCGFSTKYQSHLIAHKRIHSGDVFRCQFSNCKYSTPKRSQLACHMRTHMSIRSHICSQCGRAFIEKSHLVRHEKIHLDEKPFKCDYCDYSSTRRDKLKDHITKYHGESSPKTPYKPRKSRRQTFDPQAFPLLSNENASVEMTGFLQQSVDVREQGKQDNTTVSLAEGSAADNMLQTQIIETQPAGTLQQSLFVVSTSQNGTSANVITESVVPAQLSNQTSVVEATSLTTLNSSSMQSMLPSLLDPRVPVMLSSTQQPIMIVPHSSSNNHVTGLCSSGSQMTNQTLTELHTINQPAENTQQVTTQQDFTSLPFMNIF